MIVDEFIRLVESKTGRTVKKSGHGYIACCPAHEDSNPSLSVSEGDEGKVLVNCFSGCTIEAICSSIGIKISELFAEKKFGLNAEGSKRIVYPYHDQERKILFSKIRIEPGFDGRTKSFYWERLNKHGVIVKNLEGCRKLLYRLPELMQAIEEGKTVFLVEGEKDVDKLRGYGVIASTAPESLKWHEDFIAILKNADVVILYDMDKTAFEMCEALITGIPRLISQVMTDIPQVFALEEDEIRRKDNPIIPRKVIRESIVNALMHKDYRVTSPVQIIKYANRTEFRNIGYSLKPQEQLGLPGSVPRNEILAQVFQDIHYAEAKGTGISTMREEMKKANLSVPLIESDRASNLFVLTLLPHHLFDQQDIEWLKSFKAHNLSDEEARTLIIIREKGSISNAEYRTINGVDTLTASAHLRRLRDLELLEQKGRGNATYYVPTLKLLALGISVPIPGISVPTPGISTQAPGITGFPDGFPSLSSELVNSLEKIGKRASVKEVQSVILQLCDLAPLRLPELVDILKRDADHIRKRYLAKMLELGELEYTFPEVPNHPQQAYRTKKP